MSRVGVARAARRAPSELAGGQRQQPEDRLEQRRLADAVGAEDRRRTRRRRPSRSTSRQTVRPPSRTGRARCRTTAALGSGRCADRLAAAAVVRRAVRSVRRSCRSPAPARPATPPAARSASPGTSRRPGDSVSVIVVTGMLLRPSPRRPAPARPGSRSGCCRRSTLICLSSICWSMVALSAAVGSLPSLIASRKLVGVSRFSPSALGEQREDALGRADRRAGVLLLDARRSAALYCASPSVSNVVCCCVEVGGVGRVERLVVGGDLVDHRVDVVGRVPAVRVAAVRRPRPARRRRAPCGRASGSRRRASGAHGS